MDPGWEPNDTLLTLNSSSSSPCILQDSSTSCCRHYQSCSCPSVLCMPGGFGCWMGERHSCSSVYPFSPPLTRDPHVQSQQEWGADNQDGDRLSFMSVKGSSLWRLRADLLLFSKLKWPLLIPFCADSVSHPSLQQSPLAPRKGHLSCSSLSLSNLHLCQVNPSL